MSYTFTNLIDPQDFWEKLHPDVREAVVALHEKLNAVRITEVLRTDAESERIYMEIADRLLKSGGRGLGPIDLAQFQAIEHMSSTGVRQWARLRPSWHKPWCAVDLSLHDWDSPELEWVRGYLAKRCPKPMWEVIMEPHGTGPHLHLARRDYGWLKEFPGSLRSAQGRKNPSPPQ